MHRRLWVKLLAAYLAPVAAVVGVIAILAHQAARNALEIQLGESLIALARAAADQVARPRAVHLRPGDEESRTYRNLRDKLQSLRRAGRVKQIYLFDLDERTLVDSEGVLPIGEHLVTLAASRSELEDVFAGRARASMLFAGSDGSWYKTGFAPVSIDGRVVAAIGVDGSARFFGPLSELEQTLAALGGAALLLIVLISLWVSRAITRPLARLAEAARRIGRGEFDVEIDVRTQDEIGMLSGTLNEMRQSILERDRNMQMMLSGIAHEVRNPLGGMTLFIGLLRDELAGQPEALKHLDRIDTETDYLARVVNDFLDFARKRPLQIDEVDPRAELEEIRALCASELERAGVELDCSVAESVTRVYWDAERMRRALLNLVRNAVQASPAGGRVEIELLQTPDGLLLRIADLGCGIPQDKIELIFEPFFTTRQQGTGLGLSMVRKVVEGHGGRISIASQEGRGSTFDIHLPEAPPSGDGEE
ncbi:MAG: HAMP domain-containing histidine kinase [Deltaproteobacteria bacterium]|nr:HAMP domain-containing histidine kinase [Deltaproteobacteria bacterium]